jgi:PKD repeat protein
MSKASLLSYTITSILLAILLFSTACKDENNDPGPQPEVLKAAFSAAPFEGHAPMTVQFTDESTGSPTSWQWDFQGDGLFNAFEKDPSYTYDDPGFYDVTLVAGDSEKSDTLTVIGYIYLNRDDEQLNYNGTLEPGVGTLTEIPLRIGHEAEFGAITLSLLYDKRLIEIDTIEGVMSGYLSSINQENGSIFIAWSSVNPLTVNQDDVLFRIKARVLTGIEPVSHYIRIGAGTEFADASANIITDIELLVPYIDAGDKGR